jgi:hypothetical protein
VKTKLLTLEDYQEAGKHFWDKFYYIHKELGDGATVEDTLKVMEAVGSVALRLKQEEDEDGEGPFGFNKQPKTDD